MPVHVKLDGRVNIVKMVNKFIMSYPLVKIKYIPQFEAKNVFFRKTKCECTHYSLFLAKAVIIFFKHKQRMIELNNTHMRMVMKWFTLRYSRMFNIQSMPKQRFLFQQQWLIHMSMHRWMAGP